MFPGAPNKSDQPHSRGQTGQGGEGTNRLSGGVALAQPPPWGRVLVQPQDSSAPRPSGTAFRRGSARPPRLPPRNRPAFGGLKSQRLVCEPQAPHWTARPLLARACGPSPSLTHTTTVCLFGARGGAHQPIFSHRQLLWLSKKALPVTSRRCRHRRRHRRGMRSRGGGVTRR